MNPPSSFSFGKIIKTFIPGLIATGALLLLFDLVWFEFQLNSAAALLVTGAAYAVTVLWIGFAWSVPIGWLANVVIPLTIVMVVAFFLIVAGEENLRRYQEGFVWFLIGTLHFREAQGSAEE